MKIDLNKKGKKNLLISLCSFACAAIFFILFIFISKLNELVYGNTLRSVEEIAAHDVKNIDAILDTTWGDLEYIGSNIRQRDFGSIKEVLDYLRIESEMSRFSFLGVVDSEGNLYNSAYIFGKLREGEEEKEFLEGKIDRFAERYDLYLDAEKGDTESLFYAVRVEPFFVGDKEIIGLMARSPLTDIEKTILIDSFGGEMYSIVFNKNGDMVANIMRNGTQDMRENFYKQMERASLREGYSVERLREDNGLRKSYTMRYTDSNGVEKILYAAPVQNTMWTFAVIVPYDVFMAQNTRLINTVMVMLLCLTGILIVMLVVMYHLVRTSTQIRLEAQSKSAFLSNMSHEIRTPLNGIIGLNHLMNLYIDNKEKVQGYLKKSNETADYLLSLVNDILDMSKLQANSMEIEKEPFVLTDLAEALQDMQKDNFSKRGIRFTMDNHIDYPYLVGDEVKLKQVLMNILSNAAKFTSKGGTVSFMANQSLDGKETVETVIQISDTGCGMTKEFQDKIFDAFTQERNKNSNSVKGTGLGMSISYLIMKEMGGSISVESQLGKGSTFTVRFSSKILEELPKEAELSYHADLADGKPVNVLLAEDNALNAEILIEILRHEGFQVSHAEDGGKVVEMFEQSALNEYDVILMDVQMPVMSGYEACKMIRNMDREDAKSVLIFACTANAFAEDRNNALNSGMNDFLVKPVDVNLLLQKLDMTKK